MRRILFSLAAAALPAALLALPTGAPSGHAGVDGEETCLACHAGIALNSGGGNVTVTFPGSFVYRPGVRQRLRVTVNDTVASAFGFQITARRADDVKLPGGSFGVPPGLAAAAGPGPGPGGPGGPGAPGGPGGPGGPFGAAIRVVCWSGNLDDDDAPKRGDTCPSDRPIESLVQGRPVFGASNGTATWDLDWTPPASNVGQVKLYISANAAEDEDHARVYTTSITLDPETDLKPAIRSISLMQGYGAGNVYSPGTWINVQGTDLAGSSRQSSSADFTGNTAPSELDSVRVMVGGKPAFLSLESPVRILAQIPADVGTGNVPVMISINGRSSAPVSAQMAARSPYLASRAIGGKNYLAAAIDGGGQISPPRPGGPGGPGGGGFGNARPAAPGDVIRFNGIGFGPTVPNTPPGQRAAEGASLPGVEIKFGDKTAEVRSATLSTTDIGIYLFTVVVPDGLASGEVPVSVTVGGVKSTQDLLLPTR